MMFSLKLQLEMLLLIPLLSLINTNKSSFIQ